MRYPIVVDGRNLFDPKVMQDTDSLTSASGPAVYPAASTPATPGI
jgi:hypothetical protein